MKKRGYLLIIAAVILATLAGATYAREATRIESAQAHVENGKAAKWIKVEGNEFVAFYIDPSSIRNTGNKATMSTLVNFKTVIRSGGYARMSEKTRHEYDCKEEQWRLLSYTFHSGNMGGGETVYADTRLGTWEPLKPGSGTKKRWKLACGKQ